MIWANDVRPIAAGAIRYVMTNDGMIYPVTLHIAKARDGRNILYDVNVHKNEGIAADKTATSLRAQKLAKQAFRTTIPSGDKVTHPKPKVKKKSNEELQSGFLLEISGNLHSVLIEEGI